MKSENTKDGKKETRIMKSFSRLLNRLSPENLYCDGEISRTEAKRREKAIRREWAVLARELGRGVSEEDIYEWEDRAAA